MTAPDYPGLYEVLRAEVGSTIHGIATGSDDRDEIGVAIEPPERLYGMQGFEHYVYRTQPDGVPSGPGDLDLTVYSLRKFCRLACKGNPSALLSLFVPEERCPIVTETGRALRALSTYFASKRAGRAYLKYMEHQLERWQGKRGQKNVQRPELVASHGYDTKYAGHVLRLGYQGIEYLRTRRVTLPMPPAQRDFVLAVRLGEVAEMAALRAAGNLHAALSHAYETSALPDEPNYDYVDQFLVHAYTQAYPKEMS